MFSIQPRNEQKAQAFLQLQPQMANPSQRANKITKSSTRNTQRSEQQSTMKIDDSRTNSVNDNQRKIPANIRANSFNLDNNPMSQDTES